MRTRDWVIAGLVLWGFLAIGLLAILRAGKLEDEARAKAFDDHVWGSTRDDIARLPEVQEDP